MRRLGVCDPMDRNIQPQYSRKSFSFMCLNSSSIINKDSYYIIAGTVQVEVFYDGDWDPADNPKWEDLTREHVCSYLLIAGFIDRAT